MKFTITFEVPDGTTFQINPVEVVGAFVPPFEDELIPLPPEAIPVQGDPAPFRAPQARQAETQNLLCPVHHEPWKIVQAGVSKSTGRPYNAFWGCSSPGKCNQRPTAQFLATHPIPA